MHPCAPTYANVSFIVAGFQKGGTTALKTFLRHAHPDTCVPDTEIGLRQHCSKHSVYSQEGFSSQLSACACNHSRGATCAIGTSSPTSVYDEISQYAPGGLGLTLRTQLANLKVVLLMREPMQRAMSSYRMLLAWRLIYERTSFETV